MECLFLSSNMPVPKIWSPGHVTPCSSLVTPLQFGKPSLQWISRATPEGEMAVSFETNRTPQGWILHSIYSRISFIRITYAYLLLCCTQPTFCVMLIWDWWQFEMLSISVCCTYDSIINFDVNRQMVSFILFLYFLLLFGAELRRSTSS